MAQRKVTLRLMSLRRCSKELLANQQLGLELPSGGLELAQHHMRLRRTCGLRGKLVQGAGAG